MKRSLIPFLVFMLLLGVSFGANIYAQPAYASGGEKKSTESADGVPQISYISMDPIILPIIDRDGISQTISLVVSIQVNDPVNAEEVRANLPKLADAYLSDMYGTLSKKSSMEGGVVKVSMLKARLVSVSQKVMGKDKINDVLLQVLQQHPV
ncbi:MAG TPA: hypothetical protein VIN59_06915 [Alphaproteobacteria bacterium]